MLENNFTDLEEILKTDIDFLEKIKAISKTIKSLVKAERCTIFIHDPKTHSFWSAYIEGTSYIELPDTSGIVHEIFEKNQAEIINSVQTSKEYNMNVEKNTGYFIHSMIAAPIIDESQKPIGVIQVINKMTADHQFSDVDQEILSKLLHHINQYTKSLKGI